MQHLGQVGYRAVREQWGNRGDGGGAAGTATEGTATPKPDVSPARLIEHGAGIFGPELELVNDRWRLRVGLGEKLDPYELYDQGSGRYVADESYCYQLAVSPLGEPGYRGGTVPCQRVRAVDWSLEETPDAATLVLIGHLDFGPEGPTNIRLEHRIAALGAHGEGGAVALPSSRAGQPPAEQVAVRVPQDTVRPVLVLLAARMCLRRAGPGPAEAPCRPGYRPLPSGLCSRRPLSAGMDKRGRAPQPERGSLAVE